MAREGTSSDSPSPTFRIEAPRVGDAIGLALRGAYDRDLGLPEDMALMLRQLNGASTRGH